MPHIHIRRSAVVPTKTKDANFSGSFRSDGHTIELDFGPKGGGEVEFSIKVQYQISAELALISKSGTDWMEDYEGTKAKNPPWPEIERAVTREINSPGFKERILSTLADKLG